MKKYEVPDKSVWAADDPRQEIDGFAEEPFRLRYNEWMVPEAPPVPDVIALGLSAIESQLMPMINSLECKDSALDIGCGNGRFMVYLLRSGIVKEITLIDVSDAMVNVAIETAEMNGCHAIVLGSSLEQFQTGSRYDIIVASEVLEHIFNLRAGLQKVACLLKEAGLFCGTVPDGHTCDAVVHLHYFGQADLVELLKEFFLQVSVWEVDADGQGEMHLAFACKGRRTNEEDLDASAGV